MFVRRMNRQLKPLGTLSGLRDQAGVPLEQFFEKL
jgi:hypothetical protein